MNCTLFCIVYFSLFFFPHIFILFCFVIVVSKIFFVLLLMCLGVGVFLISSVVKNLMSLRFMLQGSL